MSFELLMVHFMPKAGWMTLSLCAILLLHSAVHAFEFILNYAVKCILYCKIF